MYIYIYIYIYIYDENTYLLSLYLLFISRFDYKYVRDLSELSCDTWWICKVLQSYQKFIQLIHAVLNSF